MHPRYSLTIIGVSFCIFVFYNAVVVGKIHAITTNRKFCIDDTVIT